MLGGQKGAANMYSAATDDELHGWLVRSFENGSGFLQAVAEAALVADLKNYNLLRPLLVELKKTYPEN